MFQSRVDPGGEAYADNRADMLALVEDLRALEGRAAAESARSDARFERRGQLPPRERVARLLDPGAPFLELRNLAGHLVDEDDPQRSVPGGSQLVGIGFVRGARVMVAASDAGIGAGAMTRSGVQKVLRAQDIALEQRLPFVQLVESAGANLLRYEVELWAEGGRSFHNLARHSAAGLPVVTVLHGSSTAGGAYLPGLSDVVIGVREQGRAFLAGPPLLRAATGEIADDQELGGVAMHSTVTGLVEHVAQDDADALRIARDVIAAMRFGAGWSGASAARATADPEPPLHDPDELAGVVPVDHRTAYDVREVIVRLVDGSRFVDHKPAYGPATVCVEASVHGHAVGIIGNNGPLDNAGAAKATQFIQRCSQLGTPLVFLQNITGYMVGLDAERGGMIKHGSKMIQAVTNATVPRFTFVIGASFGAGNYGMSGQGYSPRFLFTWPNARSGVMGAEQAATTMRIVAEQRAARKGEVVDAAQLDAFSQHIVDLYSAQEPAFVTSGRGLDDGVIDPRDTRALLGFLLATQAEAEAAVLRPTTFGVARP